MSQSNPFTDFVARYGPDPVGFVREVVGKEPYPDQIEFLDAYRRGERRISKRSGHRVGKSTSLAWIAVHHILTKYRQKTVITSASAPQLWDALAAEVKSVIAGLPPGVKDLLEVQSEGIYLKGAPDDSFISFRVSKAETPEAMAGVHSDHVLLICDEASGIPEPVFEAAQGSMAGHNATVILAGNPVRTSGLFFKTFRDPVVSARWWTQHVPSLGHPNVTPDFADEIEAQYGKDSNAYRVRILGDFPKAEDDTVIPWEWIEASYERDVQPSRVRPVWGLDVAYTGSDRSALCKRKGNVVPEKIKTWTGLDNMQLCGVIVQEWNETPHDERPDEILTDLIGWGAGVTDRLRELGLPARGVNVAELPAMRGRYYRLRDELYFLAREWFETRSCRLGPENKDLGMELSVIHYEQPTSDGKTKVEGRDKIKKYLRGKSPDLASSFVLTFAASAASALYGGSQRTSWNEPQKRKIAGVV